jgi:hypothetical protein
MSELWEILVPCNTNDGEKISVGYHRMWDVLVQKISGGLTILKSATGVWEDANGMVFREKMIPCV